MSDKKLDSKCFTQLIDGCVEYTGDPDSTLNIEQGYSLRSVIEALVKEVVDIRTKLNECGLCTGEGNPLKYSTISSDEELPLSGIIECAESSGSDLVPTNNSYTIKTVPGATNVAVNYDLSEAIPKDAKVLSNKVMVEGMANGEKGLVAESKQLSGGFTVAPDNFPASLDVQTRIQTKDGDELLMSKVQLSSTGQDAKPFLNKKARASAVATTQKEANQVFDEQICRLKSQVNSLNKVSINGCPGIPETGTSVSEILSILYNEICSLKSKLSDASELIVSYQNDCDDCGDTKTSKKLSEALTTLSEGLCDTKDSIQTINNTVASQQTQIKNIPTIIQTGTTTGPGTGGPGTTKTYVYVCETGGCKSYESGKQPSGKTAYTTLEECQKDCKSIGDPVPSADCEVRVKYGVGGSCGLLDSQLLSALNALNLEEEGYNITYSNTSYTFTNCAYRAEVLCNGNTFTLDGANATTVANQVKSTVLSSCPCAAVPDDEEVSNCDNFAQGVQEVTTLATISFIHVDGCNVEWRNTSDLNFTTSPLTKVDGRTYIVKVTCAGEFCGNVNYTYTEPPATDLCTGVVCNGCQQCEPSSGACKYFVGGEYRTLSGAQAHCASMGEDYEFNIKQCICQVAEPGCRPVGTCAQGLEATDCCSGCIHHEGAAPGVDPIESCCIECP